MSPNEYSSNLLICNLLIGKMHNDIHNNLYSISWTFSTFFVTEANLDQARLMEAVSAAHKISVHIQKER